MRGKVFSCVYPVLFKPSVAHERAHRLRQRGGVTDGAAHAAVRLFDDALRLAGGAGQHRHPAGHVGLELRRDGVCEKRIVHERYEGRVARSEKRRYILRPLARDKKKHVLRAELFYLILQRGLSAPVADDDELRRRSGSLQQRRRLRQDVKPLRHADVAREYHPEPPILRDARVRALRRAVKLLGILRPIADLVLLARHALLYHAHEAGGCGEYSVAAAVDGIHHAPDGPEHKRGMYAGDYLDIFRPEILHVYPAGYSPAPGVPHAGKRLRHRRDFKYKHHVRIERRGALPEPARHDEGDVVQAHANGAFAARDERDADNVHAHIALAPLFEKAVAVEIPAVGVVRDAREHGYLIPAPAPLGAHVVYSERLRVEILADDQNMLFFLRCIGHCAPSVIRMLSSRLKSLYSPRGYPLISMS